MVHVQFSELAPAPTPPDTGRGSDARLDFLAVRLGSLATELAMFWKTRGPDREHGGFHGMLDRRGLPTEPSDKTIIQQARHLWAMSMWYGRRESTPEVKALAHDLYRFVDRFRDAGGEYFYQLNRRGEVVDPKKALYAQSFAIYGLSEFAWTFGVGRAAEQALACFRSLDARAHDERYGGYDQRTDPGWHTLGCAKSTNTLLHLMEAFTTLYAVTGDELVRRRCTELVELFCERIVQPAGYAAQEFDLDWTPRGAASVSYGHDLETAWLLLETVRVLKLPKQPCARVCRRLAENSALLGYDNEHGGYFEEGPAGGAPTKLEKIWWVQAEAIPGLLLLYFQSGDSEWLTRIERTLDFVERQLRDAEFGEWFWGVMPDGSPGPRGDHKGEGWKASYHNLRGLVFAEDWLRNV